jgi:hypothetical protein
MRAITKNHRRQLRWVVLLTTVGLLAACGSSSPSIGTSGSSGPESAHGLADPSQSTSPVANPNTANVVDGLPGEPNPALTPGVTNPAVTQANIKTTICKSGWSATVRPPESYTEALNVPRQDSWTVSGSDRCGRGSAR